jgi:hypothetical protein
MAPIVLNIAAVRANTTDMKPFAKYVVAPFSDYLQEQAGKEHHQLAAALSKQLPKGSVVCDINTFKGTTAVAFASNPDVTVRTYDTVDNIKDQPVSVRDLPNVVVHVGDVANAFTEENLKDVKLIMIDVDPHNGQQEKVMIEKLMSAGYKGALLLDDIILNADMKALWDWIPDELVKFDVTTFGHFTGTGIVLFDTDVVSISFDF